MAHSTQVLLHKTSWVSRVGRLLGLLVVLLVAAGCGGSSTQGETKTAADIPAGSMPDAGEWEGVYYNQTYGFLHLTVSGDSAQGAWETTAGDKWGELYGEIEGDLLRFSWKEHKKGIVGPNATTEGHGYFRYTIPNPEEPHELKGEWGLGESATGHPWDLLKQANMRPDPKSVRPDELESRVGAQSWDGGKGDKDIASDSEDEAPEAGDGDDEGEGESEESSEE